MPKVQQPKVNINQATLEELISVNGLGPSLAQSIIDQRPFEKLSDLVRVSGINEIKLASLLPAITLKEPDTVTPSQETLQESIADDTVERSTEPSRTKTFTLCDNYKDQQDAILIILAGFFLGLFLLLLRRKSE